MFSVEGDDISRVIKISLVKKCLRGRNARVRRTAPRLDRRYETGLSPTQRLNRIGVRGPTGASYIAEMMV
jgi:hypothetical protein